MGKRGFIFLITTLLITLSAYDAACNENPNRIPELLDRAFNFYKQGENSRAIEQAESVIQMLQEQKSDNAYAYIQALDIIGDSHFSAGNLDQALDWNNRSIEMKKRLFGEKSESLSHNRINLGMIYRRLNQLDKAEENYKSALEILESIYGKNHNFTLICLSGLADVHHRNGEFDKSEELYKRSILIAEKEYGPESQYLAMYVSSLADLYRDQRNFDQAEPLMLRAISILEKSHGPYHPTTLLSKRTLADAYRFEGMHEKALALLRENLAGLEKTLGLDHPATAEALSGMSNLLLEMGNLAEAEKLALRALEVREKLFGPNHQDVAVSLRDAANVLYKKGDYPGALSLLERAAQIDESVYGPESMEVATDLNNLANLNAESGDYARAVKFLERSIAIQTALYGENAEDLAPALNNLGWVYLTIGEVDRGGAYLARAENVLSRKYGPDYYRLANIINNQAWLRLSIGDYSKAESLFKRSLGIMEKHFGPEHIDLATPLNNLAALYASVGDSGQAAYMLERALYIMEKTIGTEHPNTAKAKNNLAWLYGMFGEDEKAEKFHNDAVHTLKKTLGDKHPEYGNALAGLAWFYMRREKFDNARGLLLEAVNILEQAYGREHLYVAQTIALQAVREQMMGNWAEAAAYYRKAMDASRNIEGETNPNIILIEHNIGLLTAAMGEYDKALELLLEAHRADDEHIADIMSFTSEEQKSRFLSTRQTFLEALFTLQTNLPAHDRKKNGELLDIWFKRKGIILETQRRFQEALFYDGDKETVELFKELARSRAGLAGLIFKGAKNTDPELYQRNIAELKIKIEQLEAELSRKSKAYARYKKTARADCRTVADALPPESVLIEFVQYKPVDFLATWNRSKDYPVEYAAFVLPAGAPGEITYIPLGKANVIDDAITRLKKALMNLDDLEGREASRAAEELYNLVFKPIEVHLGGSREIYVAPDGALNLIPFEVLKSPDGKYLIEDYMFNYLSSGRDLPGFSSSGDAPGASGKAFLIGDPDFNIKIDDKGKRDLEEVDQENSPPIRDFRGIEFTPLPGTREETLTISRIIGENQSELLLGENAREEALNWDKPPRILHIATHGFFLADEQFKRLVFGRDLGMEFMNAMPEWRKSQISMSNPLLRSGLALAGANTALSSEKRSLADGLFTSNKVLGMNLRGTEMVVLSACQTGLGEIRTGEGVYGLRRAFTQSGADSIVMSMWPVPDLETKELMIDFYKNIFDQKMKRCQALRQAILTVKKNVKKRYGVDNPVFWGAFVYLGASR